MGIGTSIVTRTGPVATLAASQVRHRAATVYNFEVENTHTYFVGHSDLWVHNLCVRQINRVRHFLSKMVPGRKLVKKELTTLIDPKIEATVLSEEAAIIAAEANETFVGTNITKTGARYLTSSGRVYELFDGHLIPVSGPGFSQLGRQSFAAFEIMVLNYTDNARALRIIAGLKNPIPQSAITEAERIYQIWKTFHKV